MLKTEKTYKKAGLKDKTRVFQQLGILDLFGCICDKSSKFTTAMVDILQHYFKKLVPKKRIPLY
jgi:hypothetical protein